MLATESAWAEQAGTSLSSEEQALIAHYVFGGVPDCPSLRVRKGYILCFEESRRVPSWVAYRVEPDYLNTPPRTGRFKTFRADPALANEAKDSEYVGLHTLRGYARGHLAPYAVMGGDRDGDGLLADEDPEDERTIFESNYMSNIAPQHHDGFNGSGGLWYNLERWVQERRVAGNHRTVWVFAGTIFGSGEPEKVGPNRDIHVPPMFYKIVIEEGFSVAQPKVVAFLFPHQRIGHGRIQDFTVSIDVIEAMTGLDFFSDLDDSAEAQIEDMDTWSSWNTYFIGTE